MTATQLPSVAAILRWAPGIAMAVLLSVISGAQTPPSPSPGARGVIRLRVRLKIGDSTKGLSRKRFFLIKGTLEDNKILVQRSSSVRFSHVTAITATSEPAKPSSVG